MPGKHGFAYKVGYSAWQVKDCVKADQYLKHFVKYGDPNKQADWMNEAKSILGEISASGCAEQATPATTPTTTTTEPVGDDDDAPILTGTREQREEENRKAKNQADNEKKGMLIGGAVLIGLGVGFVGMGVGMNFFAKSNTDKLEDLSSNGTSTGFPQGSWPEEGEKADQNRKIGNALAITGYAAGGVMLATGVALVVLHVKRKGGGGKNAKAGNGKAELTGIGPAMFDRGGGFAASLRF